MASFQSSTTQVSLVPPPWDELTTSEPSRSATRVRPPGTTRVSLPDKTNGRKSICRGAMPFSTKVGQVDSDSVGCAMYAWGLALMRSRKVLDFRCRRCRPDQHAVTAGALGFLDHQIWKIGQHVGKFRRVAALPGRHVLQDRLFIQVETDHVGDKRVHRFVVRHPGADGIGQHHVAGAIGRQQPRHAEHRVRD